MTAAKHGFSVVVSERGANDKATVWAGRCSCRKSWEGPTYEAVEDDWRRHVYEAKGTVPRPMGEKSCRWSA